jgi:tetratricopeptide (TPR) repeat protein
MVAGKYLSRSELDSRVLAQATKFEAELALQKAFEAELSAKGLDKTVAEFSHPKNGVVLREGFLNNLGYGVMGQKKVPQAVTLFELNVKLHPQSANVYDSLGEAYLAAGDKKRGLKCYARAASLDPTNATAAKIVASNGPAT